MTRASPTINGSDEVRRRRMRRRTIVALVLGAALNTTVSVAVASEGIEALVERLERLEAEAEALREEIRAIARERAHDEAATARTAPPAREGAAAQRAQERARSAGQPFGARLLDPTTDINSKARVLLEARRDGVIDDARLHLHGALTAVADYQRSNRADKFGYLMRHPTARNQAGMTASEVAVHSAELTATGTVASWLTGYARAVFNPMQSFGAGTTASVDRNRVEVHEAYALFGNLRGSRWYATLGKRAVPFGLTDTLSPFTASSVWHAFGVLGNAATAGYAGERMAFAASAIQGGAQPRGANAPVRGTAVPSRVNNFALDARYRFTLGGESEAVLGASYLHGSAYCQDFPVEHFGACAERNPAHAVYARLQWGAFTLKGEHARTHEVWPGTFNPAIPQFPASRVDAFDIGARYEMEFARGPLALSGHFSRFTVGPSGAPWERQDQLVLGAAWRAHPNATLFAEYVHVRGYVPLNFISGGNLRDAQGRIDTRRTHSEREARTDALVVGTRLTF